MSLKLNVSLSQLNTLTGLNLRVTGSPDDPTLPEWAKNPRIELRADDILKLSKVTDNPAFLHLLLDLAYAEGVRDERDTDFYPSGSQQYRSHQLRMESLNGN